MKILVAGLLTAAGMLFAQSQTPTVFRGGVDLIHFDVSVLDKDRRPVRGLKAEDFVVTEDGKPQPIVAFSAIDLPDPEPMSASWMSEAPSDVRTNEIAANPEGRLFVILIDDALIPFDPKAIQNAKQIARSVVARMSAIDQVAVVFSVGSGGTQNFTTDRARLLNAIDTLTTGYATYALGWDAAFLDRRGRWVPAIDHDSSYRAGSFATLKSVADTLIASPQRRKSLIFISPGITADVETAARPINLTDRVANADGSQAAKREANASLVREMPDLFRRMQHANVTIYPIDPCGVGGLEGYVLSAAAGLRPLAEATTGLDPGDDWMAPPRPPLPTQLARHFSAINMEFLMTTAQNTGGSAIVNTNDFEAGLDRVFAENASYYLLGYPVPARSSPGSQHRVTVKVNRQGVLVRTRNGYTTPSAEAVANASSPLAKSTAGPVPNGDLPMRVVVAPVPVSGAKDPVVTIVTGLSHPPVSERTSQTIELQMSAFTPDGRPRGVPSRQTASLTLVPGRGLNQYELLTQMSLPPGRYELRLAATRQNDGVSGSVYTDVEVPDFAKAPLSMTGIWLDADPGPTAAPADAFVRLAPVAPTSLRSFSSASRVTTFFRIIEGGDAPLAPVTLNVRIVNDRDATLVNVDGSVGVDRFNAVTRAADHRFTVPLSQLPPGRYLLTFTATMAGQQVRRDVRFEVVR